MSRTEEDRIHRAILEYLRTVLPRPRAGPIHYPAGGLRKKGVAGKMKGLGQVAGVPDLIWWLPTGSFAFEVKTDTGRLSPAQRAFISDLESVGVRVAVVRSIDDARRALNEWGIKVRERAS